MRLKTKTTLLQLATATAIVCTAAMIFLPVAASARSIVPLLSSPNQVISLRVR